jgi:hypothetical protein
MEMSAGELQKRRVPGAVPRGSWLSACVGVPGIPLPRKLPHEENLGLGRV